MSYIQLVKEKYTSAKTKKKRKKNSKTLAIKFLQWFHNLKFFSKSRKRNVIYIMDIKILYFVDNKIYTYNK